MSSKELETQKIVVHKFEENPAVSARSIAKMLKLPQTTVSGIIKRFKETKSVGRKSRGVDQSRGLNKQLSRR